MDTTDKSDDILPEGFEHVAERLRETSQRLESIDKQIDSLPKDRGLALEYKPPYFVGRKPGQQQRTLFALKEQQQQLKGDTLTKTEADTRGVDPKDGRIVRDQVREKLFPNPYRGLSREGRLVDKHVVKEIEQSQDYMDAQLVARAAERQSSAKTEGPLPAKAEQKTMSMSTRFSQSLGYTKAILNIDPSPAKSPGKDKDIDRA